MKCYSFKPHESQVSLSELFSKPLAKEI